MDEQKQRNKLNTPKKKRRSKSQKKGPNWEKYGVVLALAGTVTTSIFSAIQWAQTQDQLKQGNIAIRQTQGGLKETRRQNQLAVDQFSYSRKQDSLRDFQDSLDTIEKNKQFKENIVLLTAQTQALLKNNEVAINSKSPDVRVILKEDTVSISHVFRQGSYSTYRNIVHVFLQNIGDRTAEVSAPAIYVVCSLDNDFQARYKGFVPYDSILGNSIKKEKLRILYAQLKLSLSLPPSKSSFNDNQTRLLTRAPLSPNTYSGTNSYYNTKSDYDRSDIAFVLVVLSIKDSYTKRIERQYYAFDLVRQERSFKYIVTPMPLARQSELVNIVTTTPH